MSVIIVGVGGANFSAMRELDADDARWVAWNGASNSQFLRQMAQCGVGTVDPINHLTQAWPPSGRFSYIAVFPEDCRLEVR